MGLGARRVIGYLLLPGILIFAGTQLPLPTSLEIAPYAGAELSVYSNREYVNTKNHQAFEGMLVVRVPRHHQHEIVIESRAPFRAFRLLSERNRNEAYRDWQREPVEALVEGRSCSFREVVSKSFPAGTHRLTPGGPVAASPLLLRASPDSVRASSVHSFNRVYGPWLRTADGVPFHTSKKTLLGWAAIWLLLALPAALRLEGLSLRRKPRAAAPPQAATP